LADTLVTNETALTTFDGSEEMYISDGADKKAGLDDLKTFMTDSTWTIVIKTADETVTASTTLQDDNHLKFNADANSDYLIRVNARCVSPAAADVKETFAVPTNGSGVFTESYGTAAVAYQNISTAESQGTTGGAEGSTIPLVAFINIGDTAGEIIFQWAQLGSDAGNTVMKLGSTL